MTILQEQGRKPTISYKSKHKITPDIPMSGWLVGLELEIENFNPEVIRTFGGLTFTDDGSLRTTKDGIGIEAITKPLEIQMVEGLLTGFFAKFGITNRNYSERCSTHVHFNVEPLEWSHIAALCLVYQTVERLLFKFVGDERENSIFCVPWNQCNLSYQVVSNLETRGPSVLRKWQKYSALNLLPIHIQGTVEFRHLGGTCDVKKIMTWIILLAKIFQYITQTPFQTVKNEIINMNTVSNYYDWTYQVFGQYVEYIQYPDYAKDLAQGVIESKLQLMSEDTLPSFDEVYILNNGMFTEGRRL